MFSFFKKLKSKRWFLPTLLLVVAVVLFIPKGSASAADLEVGMLGGIVCSIIATVLYVPAMIAIWIMQLGGNVLSSVMAKSFNENLYIGSPFVQIAWGFCRDFANLFFIVWLVIIAVCLMLDIKSFNAKKRLIQLISIALLVNFSLVFCGFMIDIAQGLMYFFTQTMVRINDGQQPYSLADGLTKVFKQSGLFGIAIPPPWEFVGLNSSGALENALRNFLVLIFAGVAAYGFVMLAVMLIVRIVALWILLIFAPLAWVFGIMPFGKSASTKWWKEFWAWNFYGVTMAFFLYLACMAVWALDKSQSWTKFQKTGGATMVADANGYSVPLLNDFTMLLQYMVVIVLIIIAVKFGKKGTSEATNMAASHIGKYMSQSFGKKGVGGWAWRKTGGAAWEGTKNQAGKYKDNLKNRFGGSIGRLGNRFPSGAGRVLARKGAKMQENARKSQEKRTGQAFDYSHLTEDEKIALVSKLRGRELEKMTQDLIKNNSVQKIDRNNPQQQEALDRMYQMAQKPGNERMLNDFEARRLDMSLRTTQEDIDKIKDPQQKAAAQKHRKDLLDRATSAGQLKNEDVIKSLSERQLSDIVTDPNAGKAFEGGFDGLTKETKEETVKRIRAGLGTMGIAGNFDVNNTDQKIKDQAKKNIKIREFIAKQTGDYNAAFDANTSGWTQTKIDNREKALKDAVGKINGEKEWEKIKIDDSSPEGKKNIEMIAKNIQANQIGNAGRFLDSTKKQQIYTQLETEMKNPALTPQEKERLKNVYVSMQKNDTWPGKFDEEGQKKAEKMKQAEIDAHQEDAVRDKEKLRKAAEEAEKMNNLHGEAKDMNRAYDEEKKQKAIEAGRIEAEAYQEKAQRERGQGGEGEVPPNPDGGPNVPPNTGNNNGGAGGGTVMHGGTINAESATINAQNVNIQTPEGINTTRGVDPLITTERPISPERPIILTPEPRIGDVRFSQGAGYTPQQRKDFEELRSRKYQESTQKSSENDEENMSRNMRDEATSKAKAGNIDEAIKIAELIEEEKRQGYTLWEIASIQAEKGDFGGAIATARKIKDEGIRSSALHEIETMQDRKKEE
jgi:hypothetical protein